MLPDGTIIEVVEIDGAWVVRLCCKEYGFDEKEPLPELFKSFTEFQRQYWSSKLFRKLEKKLSRTIKQKQAFYYERLRSKANAGKRKHKADSRPQA